MLSKIGSTPQSNTQLKRNSNPSFGTIKRHIAPANSILGSLPIDAEIPLELEKYSLNTILTHLKSIDRESWKSNYTPFFKLHEFKLKDNPALTYYTQHNSDKSPPILSIINSMGESVIITHDPSNLLESKWHYQRIFGFFRKLAKDINKKD